MSLLLRHTLSSNEDSGDLSEAVLAVLAVSVQLTATGAIVPFSERFSQRFWWLVAFSRLRGFWETARPSIPFLHFIHLFIYLIIYFEVEISSRTLIPLSMPKSFHTGSAG